jgi:hypothetical protein
MRIVVCDEDALIRDMVESVVVRAGHEVVGVADTMGAAIGLIASARPDAVVLDVSLGYNTDFDIIESATETGARAIVFSHQADGELLGRYATHPIFVSRPDLYALEQVLARMEVDADHHQVVEQDRRQRPIRTAVGPPPTGPGDAQAFFESINGALPGDGMVSVEVGTSAAAVAADATHLLRGSDRLLQFPTTVRFYLPGGGEQGIQSLLARLADSSTLPPRSVITSLVVADGEHGADALDRLKHSGGEPTLG